MAILALLALTTACGPQHPVLTPLSTPAIGLNDGFHGPLPSALAARYSEYRTAPVLRTPQLSKAALNTFLLSVAGLPIRTLALIEAPDADLAAAFGTFEDLCCIENGNELELPPHELTPEQYAEAQARMAREEVAAGFRGDILMGGVYALTEDTKRAITLALPRCPGCLVGVHLYTITREDIDWLNGLGADIAITETGSPTNCQPAKLPAQAAYQQALYAKARQIHRLKYFIVYQGPSGPGCSNLDTFGIVNKPAEEFFSMMAEGRGLEPLTLAGGQLSKPLPRPVGRLPKMQTASSLRALTYRRRAATPYGTVNAIGATNRNRTCNLALTKGALCQLELPWHFQLWRRVKDSNLHAGEGVGFRDRGDTNSATTLRKSRYARVLVEDVERELVIKSGSLAKEFLVYHDERIVR